MEESNSMGKTRRWLRSFFCRRKEKTTKKKKQKEEERSFVLPNATRSGPLPRTTPKEKREEEEGERWSFRKPDDGSNELKFPDLGSYGAPKIVAATDFSPTHRIPAPRTSGLNITLEELASIRIQASFRGHLARKALRALRGLVKLQALVRGHLVRKEAATMLRCMETLLSIQARAQARRTCSAEGTHTTRKKQPAFPSRCTSLRESRNRHGYFHINLKAGLQETRKDAEIGKQGAKIAASNRGVFLSMQRIANRASKSYCKTEPNHQQISASLSEGTTITSNKDLYQDAKSSIRSDHFHPNYMSNTESWRAKARSQSAPKQRMGRHEREAPRRPLSVDGKNISSCVGMQRASQSLRSHCPCPVMVDGPNMSLKSRVCGSTGTNFTAANS